MSTDPDQAGCRRSLGARIAGVLNAMRPARRGRRCEDRSDWPDDEGLAGAGVPRRPRDPLRGGAIALELPSFDDA
jgi:hypothetical protein